jgi:hypothetical protein
MTPADGFVMCVKQDEIHLKRTVFARVAVRPMKIHIVLHEADVGNQV